MRFVEFKNGLITYVNGEEFDMLKMFAENNVPTIICPKQTCSCGLCAPKSSSKESYFNTIKNHVDVGVLRT